MKKTTTTFGYRIDFCFPKHKLVIEVNKKGLTDWDGKKEIERQMVTEKELIRINSDAKKMVFFLKLVKCKITLSHYWIN